MKKKARITILLIAATLGRNAPAQTYDTNGDYVQTFAGSGFYGLLNGTGQMTMFNEPASLAVSRSNIFVLDSQNYAIREISPNSSVSTFATGLTSAYIELESGGISFDDEGDLWVPEGDAGFYLIEPENSGQISISGTGLQSPADCIFDASNNIYISDFTANKIFAGPSLYALSVLAGSGNPGHADGTGIFTSFYGPTALALDAAGNIYVWDSINYVIRKIDTQKNVTTFAGHYSQEAPSDADGVGTNASFNTVGQMCFDGFGNLILACGTCVRSISASSNVTTLAGSFTQSAYTNGPGNLARFNGAYGVCVVGTNLFVADSGNQRIRVINFSTQPLQLSPAQLQLNTYAGLQIAGTIGGTYQIQSSPDMTNWTTRATLLLPSNPYLWIDTNPVSGNKFYQAILLP